MSSADSSILRPGTVLENKWIIMELLGKGAMGEVYRAHQTNLKRDVAIKTISHRIMSELEDDPEEMDIAFGRLQREVQTMAQVRHVNILTIYDYGEVPGDRDLKNSRTAYIVMEYIPGNSLRFTLSEDGLDDLPDEYGAWIRKYFLPILDGVEILHHNRIVHRDLKPENIFMDGHIPKIADFGLARSHRMKAVTTSIEMLGTLAYMSPEQCADFKNADFATDIYALGKILFEAGHGTLTEKTLPFTSVSFENPQSAFVIALNEIIKKATAESPGDRYPTTSEMKGALVKALQVLEGENIEQQKDQRKTSNISKTATITPGWPALAVVVAIAAVGSMGMYHLFKSQSSSSGLDEAPYIEHDDLSTGQQVISVENGDTLKKTLVGRDGNRMLLTGAPDKENKSQPFYMDEQKVTNFLFVEFLNSLRDTLSVKNGVIRQGETIIQYIGSGSSEEDAIIFKHNRFHLKDQDHGSRPVVRVTYHGAHLYAASYGKDLLSEKEWKYAYHFFSNNSESTVNTISPPAEQVAVNMMHASALSPPAEDEKVLDAMGRTIKEWIKRSPGSANKQLSPAAGESEAGVLDAEIVADNAAALKRSPWEGFSDVGFRTKVGIYIRQ